MEDYGSLVSTCRTVFLSGRTKKVEWRRQQLESLLKMMTDEREVFAEALNKDLNKP